MSRCREYPGIRSGQIRLFCRMIREQKRAWRGANASREIDVVLRNTDTIYYLLMINAPRVVDPTFTL